MNIAFSLAEINDFDEICRLFFNAVDNMINQGIMQWVLRIGEKADFI